MCYNDFREQIYAYLDQIMPVHAIAIYQFVEIISAGFSKSPMFAMVIAHLKVGAQKKTKRDKHLLLFTCEGKIGRAHV